jgi:hypothetical protein
VPPTGYHGEKGIKGHHAEDLALGKIEPLGNAVLDRIGEIPQHPLHLFQHRYKRTGLAVIFFDDGVYLLELFLGKLLEQFIQVQCLLNSHYLPPLYDDSNQQ